MSVKNMIVAGIQAAVADINRQLEMTTYDAKGETHVLTSDLCEKIIGTTIFSMGARHVRYTYQLDREVYVHLDFESNTHQTNRHVSDGLNLHNRLFSAQLLHNGYTFNPSMDEDVTEEVVASFVKVHMFLVNKARQLQVEIIRQQNKA